LFVYHPGFVVLIGGRVYGAASEAEDGSRVTRLSSPGKMEIVRHPHAADYSRLRGHGRITALPACRPESQEGWTARRWNLAAF
jgi:hypothetical protein